MLWLGDKLVIRTPGTEYSLMIDRAAISRGTSRWQSAEEQRDVAADVAQAIVAGVDVFVVAEAGQYHDEQDEARLHEEPPGYGSGQGWGWGQG